MEWMPKGARLVTAPAEEPQLAQPLPSQQGDNLFPSQTTGGAWMPKGARLAEEPVPAVSTPTNIENLLSYQPTMAGTDPSGVAIQQRPKIEQPLMTEQELQQRESQGVLQVPRYSALEKLKRAFIPPSQMGEMETGAEKLHRYMTPVVYPIIKGASGAALGLDKLLFKAGQKAMGIEQPKTTEEVLAEVAGGKVPSGTKVIGEIAEFVGQIKSAGKLLQTVGLKKSPDWLKTSEGKKYIGRLTNRIIETAPAWMTSGAIDAAVEGIVNEKPPKQIVEDVYKESVTRGLLAAGGTIGLHLLGKGLQATAQTVTGKAILDASNKVAIELSKKFPQIMDTVRKNPETYFVKNTLKYFKRMGGKLKDLNTEQKAFLKHVAREHQRRFMQDYAQYIKSPPPDVIYRKPPPPLQITGGEPIIAPKVAPEGLPLAPQGTKAAEGVVGIPPQQIVQAGLPESTKQIKAQFRDMLNPKTARDSVFIGKLTENPIKSKPDAVLKVTTDAGILYTTSKEKALNFKKNPSQETIAKILDFGQTKEQVITEGKPASTVVVYDKEGNRIAEELTTNPPEVTSKYQDKGYTTNKGYRIETETPEQTLTARTTAEPTVTAPETLIQRESAFATYQKMIPNAAEKEILRMMADDGVILPQERLVKYKGEDWADEIIEDYRTRRISAMAAKKPPEPRTITEPTVTAPEVKPVTEIKIGDTVKISEEPSTAHLTNAAGKTGKVIDIQISRGKPSSWAVDIDGKEFIVDGLKDMNKIETFAEPTKPEVLPKAVEAEKQPYQMTKEEYLKTPVDSAIIKQLKRENVFSSVKSWKLYIHKESVKDGIRRKESIPRNVLEEYKGEPWADTALAKIAEPTVTPFSKRETRYLAEEKLAKMEKPAEPVIGWKDVDYKEWGTHVVGEWRTPDRWVRIFKEKGKYIASRMGHGELGDFENIQDVKTALNQYGAIDNLDTVFYRPETPLAQSILKRLKVKQPSVLPEQAKAPTVTEKAKVKPAFQKGDIVETSQKGIGVPYKARVVSIQPDGTIIINAQEFQGQTARARIKKSPDELTLVSKITPSQLPRTVSVNGKIYQQMADGKTYSAGKGKEKFTYDQLQQQGKIYTVEISTGKPTQPPQAGKGKIEGKGFIPDPTVPTQPVGEGGFMGIGEKGQMGKPWLDLNKTKSPDPKMDDFFGRTNVFTKRASNLLRKIRFGIRERFNLTPYIEKAPETAFARDTIRTMPDKQRWAREKAKKDVADFLDNDRTVQALDIAGYDLVRRKTIVDDLIAEIEKYEKPTEEIGKLHYVAGNLSPAQLKTEQTRLQALIDKVPSAQKAIEGFKSLWSKVSQDLADRGVISQEDTQNQAYVRHFVLDYMEGRQVFLGKKRLKEPFRAYKIARKGSYGDISTDFLEVQVKSLGDIYSDNAVEDAANEIAEHYSLKIEKGQEIPEGHTEWFYKRPNYFYRAQTFNQAKIADMLENMAETTGDILQIPKSAIREALVLGKRKPLIIPKELAEQLDNLPVNRRSGYIVESFTKPFVQWWKRWILRSNPLRYNRRNIIGDFERLNASGRTMSVLRTAETAKILFNQTGEIYEKAKEFGVIGSSLFQEMGEVRKNKLFERFKDVKDRNTFITATKPLQFVVKKVSATGQVIQDLTQAREDILRMDVFLDALDDIDAFNTGKIKHIRHWAGSSADIEAIAKIDRWRAAAKISRETMIDYGDFTPFENNVLRQGLVPFYSFMKKNLTFWPHTMYAAAKEGVTGQPIVAGVAKVAINIPKWLVRIGGLYALLHLWNRRDEKAAQKENSLPLWIRSRPHLNIGDGVLWEQTALSDFSEWLGYDRLLGDLQRFESGYTDKEQFMLDTLRTLGQAPINKVYQGVNPYMKGWLRVYGVQTYPNVFSPRITGRPLSKKSLEGAMIDIMGTDARQFVRAYQNEDITLNDAISYYFLASTYRDMSPEKLAEEINKGIKYTSLKEKSETTGRRKGEAIKGREKEWEELQIRKKALGKYKKL